MAPGMLTAGKINELFMVDVPPKHVGKHCYLLEGNWGLEQKKHETTMTPWLSFLVFLLNFCDISPKPKLGGQLWFRSPEMS